MDHRRHRPATGRQRGCRGRLARRGGRRVRPLDRGLGAADRRHHQYRARSPRELRVRGGAPRLLRRLARRCAARRAELGAGSGRARARRSGRSQPPERSRSARCARAGGRTTRRGRSGDRPVHRRRAKVRARRRVRRRHGLRRLRPQSDRARGHVADGAVAHRRPIDRRLPTPRRRTDAPAAPRARRKRWDSPTRRS